MSDRTPEDDDFVHFMTSALGDEAAEWRDTIPAEMAEKLFAYRAEQDKRTWMTPRTGEMPEPPWPAKNNPMLEYLIFVAQKYAERDLMKGIVWLATHAWMEGHIDGYDRAMRVKEPG